MWYLVFFSWFKFVLLCYNPMLGYCNNADCSYYAPAMSEPPSPGCSSPAPHVWCNYSWKVAWNGNEAWHPRPCHCHWLPPPNCSNDAAITCWRRCRHLPESLPSLAAISYLFRSHHLLVTLKVTLPLFAGDAVATCQSRCHRLLVMLQLTLPSLACWWRFFHSSESLPSVAGDTTVTCHSHCHHLLLIPLPLS